MRIRTISILIALLAALPGLTLAAPSAIDPTDYGALGDGIHDDTAAIQKALDDATSRSKVVCLPAGSYLISDTLNIPNAVSLTAEFIRWEAGNTRLVIRKNGFPAVALHNASNVSGLVFSYPDNRIAEPVPYPPSILLMGINPSVENVVFDCAWVGISTPPEGANSGQALFRNITGHVHDTGIRLDGPLDIVRIENVHWFSPGYPTEYFTKNRVGFQFGRVDGVIMSKCFMIGGKTFLQQMEKTGKGEPAHSLGIHVTQCWTEAVKYGFLIEGICGLVLSDTQMYISDPEGAGVKMTMPYLFYHSTISNTQIRCDGSHAVGVIYAPSADHYRNHLNLTNCEIVEASTGVEIGPLARRLFINDNHIQAYGTGIVIDKGADMFFVRENMIDAEKAIDNQAGEGEYKTIRDNYALPFSGGIPKQENK